LHTLGATLARGREFTPQDAPGSPRVVIINEAAARRYWPGLDPIGKRTSRGEVVGVVRDIKDKGLMAEPGPAIYLPLLQSFVSDLTLHVRARDQPLAVVAAIRREVQSLDPSMPLYNVGTLAALKNGSLYAQRMAAALLTAFSALALLLTAIGIYGVLSFAVTERTREIGIRLSQGAQSQDVLGLFVRQGMLLTLVGLIVGIVVSMGVTRSARGLLFGVSATDPLTFLIVPVLLGLVALVACWIPARRASRLSPLVALRYE
jgi:predicted permease